MTSRPPRVFAPDDPDLVIDTAPDIEPHAIASGTAAVPNAAGTGRPTLAEIGRRGWRWGSLLVAALAGAASLSVLAWAIGFVSVALRRDDWIGQATLALLLIAALAALMIGLRELIGLLRIARLHRVKTEIAEAIADGDRKRERHAAEHVASLYAGRPALAWSLRRFREHVADVHDPGELLALAERELMLPLDAEARRVVTRSAKRVATVTALSPMAAIAVGYVAYENLRLLRSLATLYGARPGFGGMMQLARQVLTHIVATGGVAMTDDLIGQFLGHDLIRRLSRRLGEGAFNGALTARIGMTALEVIRPMPFRVAKPPRVRDVLAEVLKPIVGR
ncbi:MAG TPA: TIGR01620 family protein [Hyphomicrobiaceae bacterium]|nr:TIGR01620 family protein [Hyphomicrobiaceae bacterium]